jgi:hypothetical protein
MKHKNPTALKNLALAFAIVVLALAIYTNLIAPHTLEARQRAELESTQSKLIETKNLLQKQKSLDAQQDAEKQKQLEEVQKKLEETEKALQAKRQANTAIAAAPARASVPVSGDCESWLAAAGVTDLVNARELIRRESGCNPNAVNPSSGACGVAQELPCGKSGCSLGDGACQVRWMSGYVAARYGSWAAAVEFHDRMNWY